MAEAYRTSVSLSLQNDVSSGLRTIIADLRKAAQEVRSTQAAFDGLGRRGGSGFSQRARARSDGEADGREYGEAFAREARRAATRAAGNSLVPAPRLLTYSGGGGSTSLVSAPLLLGYSGGGGGISGGGGRGLVPSGGGGSSGSGRNAMQAMFAHGAAGIGGGGGGGGGIPLNYLGGGGGNMMAAGYVAGGMGRSMLHGFGRTAHAGMEYENQITNMRAAGQTQQEVAGDITQAWKTSGEVLSSSVVENLKTLRELRYALGDSHHAATALTGVQQMTTVLQASTGGRLGAAEAFSAAKFLEMRGAASDSGRFTQESGYLTNAIVASGGKVLPRDFLNFSKRAGSTYTAGLSNEFLYAIAPRLMQGQGGDGAGTSLASIGQTVIAGVAGQRSINAFKGAGLVNEGGITYNRNGSAKGLNPGAIKGGDLFLRDPYAWTQQYLVPVFAGKTHEELISGVARMFGNRTAARQITLYLTQQANFEKDRALYHSIQTDPFKTLSAQNPQVQMMALHAQWDNFTTALGSSMIPIIVPALQAGAAMLNWFARMSRDFPNSTRVAVLAFVGVGAALFALGRVASIVGSIQVLVAAIRGLNAAGSVSMGLTALAGGIGRIASVLGAVGIGVGLGATAGYYLRRLRVGREQADSEARARTGINAGIDSLGYLPDSARPGYVPPAADSPHDTPGAQGARASKSSYAPTRSSDGGTVHTTVVLDRRVVGEATTRWQAREMERPTSARNAFDGSRALVPV